MKIGIEGQRLFRVKKHGMDMVALELIRNLQQIDTVNEYFIFVKPDEDKGCLSETPNFHIIELEGGPYPTWEQYALPNAAAKYGCDLLHCTSNTAPVYGKIPLVVTLHDIIYLESVAILKKGGTWYQKFGNMYRRFVVPRVVSKSKKIITVSYFERDRIRNFFGFPQSDNRLVAIYNGVSTHFKPVTDQNELERVRQKYSLPSQYAFFLGNTDPKKNTRGVLQAFAQFLKESDIPLKLVMLDYEKSALTALLQEIGAPHLLDHIHLTGYVVNTDLPSIYAQAAIFLYPSLRESFGIPMLEAMRCGVPVITSNTSSMPEVSGGAALIIDPFKPEEITAAMKQILSDEMLRKELITKGLSQSDKFSWRAMAEEVLKLYHTIA